MHTRDGHIVHQCLSGNTEVFALLVDKYKERIFALVYAKVGQFQDAEDLTQDVFLEAYKNLSTLRRWDNFYPWLYSIASNQCKNYHRAQKRQVVTAHLAEHDETHRMDMDAHSEKLKNERVHDALAALPEMHRQVLVLRYMAGMKSKEIAQTLRVSPNTIDQRLVRARAKLKTILNEEMIPMIRTTFAERKLHPGFTARVVELICNAKIQTVPHKTAFPLGLSVAGGVILLLLSLSLPHSPLYPLGEWLGGSLPLKTQVVEDSMLPVDAEVTRVAILGAEGEDGDFGRRSEPLKTPAAIGQPEEMVNPNEEITVSAISMPDDLGDNLWDIDISPDGTQFVYVPQWKPVLTLYPFTGLNPSASAERKDLFVDASNNVRFVQPRWSPDGKWIALYRSELNQEDSEHYEVCIVPASGGEKRFLAHADAEYGYGLSWAPDSTELAYVKMNGKDKDIWIATLRTGEVRPFTTDGKENIQPSWSPDGKWISYLSRRATSVDSLRVWKQPVHGGKATAIEYDHVTIAQSPIHSPDGKWAAYIGVYLPEGKFGLLARRVNEQGELTGEPILVKAIGLGATSKPLRWGQDAKIIVLQDDRRQITYALNVKSGELSRASSNPELLFEGVAQWLSDGKRLLLASVKDLDIRPGLLDIETSQYSELPIEPSKGMLFRALTLSPNQRTVAFTLLDLKNVEQASGLPKGSIHIHTAPITGGKIRRLTSGMLYAIELRWSPDGQNIAFTNAMIGSSESHKSQLCVVSVSDGQMKKLTDSERCMSPAWSPDGSTIAYLNLKGDMEGDIYVLPAAGGDSKQITDTPEKEINISWTPDGKQLTFNSVIQGAVNQEEVWVASIDGGEAKMLQRGYIPSSWSSDGTSYLAIGRNGELQRISLDGKTIDELQIRVPANARPISMSPDGETILYRQITSGTQCWSIDVSHLASQ